MNVNFNTSHVTVYPEETSRIDITTEFQYISCYCLSGTDRRVKNKEGKFQYISCYCLSF